MITFTVPAKDWTMKLADAIEWLQDGDKIICSSNAMLELGKSAKMRMCPEKNITFELAADAVIFDLDDE